MTPAVLLLAVCLNAHGTPPAEPFPDARSDLRVELLGAVRLLAGDERDGTAFYGRDLPYANEVARRLAPASAHPVVARWAELERAGLGYVAAYQWILSLGPSPGFDAGEGPAGDAARAAGGAEGLEEFRLMLADFARAADFPRIYDETASWREPFVAEARAQAAAADLRGQAERYWGGPLPVRYTLILSPFMEPGVPVTRTTADADGVTRLVSVTGPEESQGRVRLDLSARRGTLWALTMDAALRPAFAAADDRLAASAALFRATGGRCAPTWAECARRQTAFAAAARLLVRAGAPATAAEIPVKYGRVGMPHIGALMRTLEDYEPADGRTLAGFVPRVLEAFDGLASSRPVAVPFAGGLAAALSDPAPCVLVAPAQPSPALAAALAAFRRDVRLCDERLTPEEALARGLAGRGAVVVGSPSQNAWLDRRWRDLRLPAHLSAAGLALDPRPGEEHANGYGGELGFVSVARNPDDVSRPVLLFTAAVPERVPALLSGFPLNADYEIRVGTVTVRTGVYEKTYLPWRTK